MATKIYMKLVIIVIVISLYSCSFTNLQHRPDYKKTITAAIWKIERNSLGGSTVYAGKYIINVWDSDITPGMAVDSLYTFNVKRLVQPVDTF